MTTNQFSYHIGDLILVNSWSGRVARLISISPPDTTGKRLVTFETTDGFHFSEGDHALRPLPLTADILLASGFTQQQFGNEYTYTYPNTTITLVLNNDSPEHTVRISRDETSEYASLHLQYTHQLQQLLRIFGIPLEIKFP